jgi:hypothetical protein
MVPELIVQLKALLAAHYRDARPTRDGNPDPIPSRGDNATSILNMDDTTTSNLSIPLPLPLTTVATDSVQSHASFSTTALANTTDWNASMPVPSSSADPFDVMAATELDWAAFFPQQFLSDFDQGLI